MVQKWMEGRLTVLPYKDPEGRIFSYGSWIPPEEVEILKRIIDLYKDEYPNMVILAENHDTWPIICWDRNGSRNFTSLLRPVEWDEKEKQRLRKAALDIFMLKNSHKDFGYKERDDLLRKKVAEVNFLLLEVVRSHDFVGEIRRFVLDTLDEAGICHNSSLSTFSYGQTVESLEREKRILEKRLELFKSLYYKSNGIKRSHKSD